MKWIILFAGFLPFLVGCATLNSVGWVNLPDGSRLKAIKYQSDTAIGTDINYVMIYHCPAEGLCLKAGEFGGSSVSFPKAIFGNSAAAAAIGAGVALQDFKGTKVNQSVEGTSGATAGAAAAAAPSATVNPTIMTPMPMPMGGGRD